VAVEYVGVARHSDRHQIEFWLTALVRTCRHLTGRAVLPSRVSFAHRRADTEEFDAFFGRTVRSEPNWTKSPFRG
jgi:hypothetical protein